MEAPHSTVGAPVAESAALARRLAPQLCRPIGPGVPDCAPYHGLVQYMRMLGIVAGPDRQADFYRPALQEAARRGGARVLVAGAADHAGLATVLEAYDSTGTNPDVTVIDRCPTPLEICRWYAERERRQVTLAVSDAARLDDAHGFDVIYGDSLLTILDPEERARALRRWRDLLRPGGRIVTSTRISPKGYLTRASREQRAAGFAELVRERATALDPPLDVDPETLSREALSYGASGQVHPIESREELERGFAAAGLAFDTLEVVELEGRVPPDRAATGAFLTATYARIVARAG